MKNGNGNHNSRSRSHTPRRADSENGSDDLTNGLNGNGDIYDPTQPDDESPKHNEHRNSENTFAADYHSDNNVDEAVELVA